MVGCSSDSGGGDSDDNGDGDGALRYNKLHMVANQRMSSFREVYANLITTTLCDRMIRFRRNTTAKILV